LCEGHFDKSFGPSRIRGASLHTLMWVPGALGCGLTIVPNPDAKVAQPVGTARDRRISNAGVKKARPIVLAEVGGKGGRSWWANMTPAERQAHIAMLNAAPAAKRQSALNKAA
jgi:hypothetical protein